MRTRLLEQAVVQRIEVGVDNGVGLQLCTVLGQRCGEIIERAFLVGSSDSAHGLDVRPGKLDAAPACSTRET